MVQVSYADVFAIRPEPASEGEIQCGDVVRTGPGPYPRYTVIAIHDDKVWLRNVQNGQDAVTGLDHCRRVEP